MRTEKDKKRKEFIGESKRGAWLSLQELKNFDAERQKNLAETDRGSWFRQSSLLALDKQPQGLPRLV